MCSRHLRMRNSSCKSMLWGRALGRWKERGDIGVRLPMYVCTCEGRLHLLPPPPSLLSLSADPFFNGIFGEAFAVGMQRQPDGDGLLTVATLKVLKEGQGALLFWGG